MKPHADTSKAVVAHSAQRRETPLPVIVISLDDDCAPPTRRAEGGGNSNAVPSRSPRIARSCSDPRAPRPLRARPTRPSSDNESSLISITSSDPDTDGPPPMTQPRAPSSASTSSQVPGRACPVHSDGEGDLRAQPLITRPRSPRDLPPATQPRAVPARGVPRLSAWRAPRTRHAASDNGSAIVDATSNKSDSDRLPPSTQPRTMSSRAVVRSRAPSCEVMAHTDLATHDDSESDSAPPNTQLQGTRSRDLQGHMHSIPAAANQLQDVSPAGSSNKENDGSNPTWSCLDFQWSARLSVRQATARHRVGVFTSLAHTSSSSSNKTGSDDDVHEQSDTTVQPVSSVQPGAEDAGARVDAAEAFGDPFRFELYPAIPGLITSINPYAEDSHNQDLVQGATSSRDTLSRY